MEAEISSDNELEPKMISLPEKDEAEIALNIKKPISKVSSTPHMGFHSDSIERKREESHGLQISHA